MDRDADQPEGDRSGGRVTAATGIPREGAGSVLDVHFTADGSEQLDARRVEHTHLVLASEEGGDANVVERGAADNAMRAKLVAQVQAMNQPLYRAMLLKDSLAHILDRQQYYVARGLLDGWLAWASRSKLAPFVSIRKHLDGVLAYLNTELSNGCSEGLSGKARVITRRSYGLHSAQSLIAMLFLCCSLPALTPVKVLPKSTPTRVLGEPFLTYAALRRLCPSEKNNS